MKSALIYLAAQQFQRALFNAGDITAADAQKCRRLLLGEGRLPAKPVAKQDHLAFPRRQRIHKAAQAAALVLLLKVFIQGKVIRDDIHDGECAAASRRAYA